jgi:hypothetical protein
MLSKVTCRHCLPGLSWGHGASKEQGDVCRWDVASTLVWNEFHVGITRRVRSQVGSSFVSGEGFVNGGRCANKYKLVSNITNCDWLWNSSPFCPNN